jgi:hypothetical protein
MEKKIIHIEHGNEEIDQINEKFVFKTVDRFVTGNLDEQLPELDSLKVIRGLVGHLRDTIIAYHLVYTRGQYKIVINLDYYNNTLNKTTKNIKVNAEVYKKTDDNEYELVTITYYHLLNVENVCYAGLENKKYTYKLKTKKFDKLENNYRFELLEEIIPKIKEKRLIEIPEIDKVIANKLDDGLKSHKLGYIIFGTVGDSNFKITMKEFEKNIEVRVYPKSGGMNYVDEFYVSIQ